MNSHKIEIDCATKRIKDWSDYIIAAMKEGNAAKVTEGKARLEFAIDRLQFAMRAA